MTECVLWSGGLDSTLVLHQKAREVTINRAVNAITVLGDMMSSKAQQVAEAKARRILKTKLPKNIRYFTIEIKTGMQSHTYQMPVWLSHVMPHLEDYDTLNLGYLSSDGVDFWQKKPDLVNAFNSTMRLLDRSNARINFPLEYWTKGDVITELKKLKLLKYAWTCGDPKKGKACGKCMKCISLKRWTRFPSKGKIT